MNSVALANVKRVDELIWHGSEMSQKLGHPPVMYMKLGTADTIVVNTVRAQADLMEKKGAIYSDRPRLIVPTELISCVSLMAISPAPDCVHHLRLTVATPVQQ